MPDHTLISWIQHITKTKTTTWYDLFQFFTLYIEEKKGESTPETLAHKVLPDIHLYMSKNEGTHSEKEKFKNHHLKASTHLLSNGGLCSHLLTVSL